MKCGTTRADGLLRARMRALLAATVAIAVLALPAVALAQSWTMPSVRIATQVNLDGSIDVIEERTFAFEGDFTRVYWMLDPPKNGEYSGITVTGPNGLMPPAAVDDRPAGFSRIVPEGAMVRVDAYGQMSDETLTYTLRYHLTGAAERWADTAELYWQTIGTNWAVPTGKVQIDIALPSGITTDQVKAWTHGPLTGSVHIQPDSSVRVEVSDLAGGQRVEPRILFPTESLSAAKPRPEARLEQALAEEKTWAEQANAARQQAQEQVQQDEAFTRQMKAAMGVCGVVVPGILFVIALVLFLRYGREYRPSFEGRYFREPPAELHPALVSSLMNMGKVEDTAISAALMDLADRGVVRMEPTTVEKSWLFGTKSEDTYLLTLDTSKWGGLGVLDQNLLSFLFTTIAGDSTLTIDEMKTEAKSRAQEFQDGIRSFKSLAAQEADAAGFVEKRSRWLMALAWVMAVVSLLLCAFAGSVLQNPIGLLGSVFAVGTVALATVMKRRSPQAADLHAKYSALRNYLKDFSRLDEAPPASVVLWNKFLVLAVVFGIADEVIAQMRVKVPQVLGDPAFATTYWWAASGSGYASPASALAGSFASAASIASSELSSSSGGGGGFSGGGGGGFGGGGGGGAD